MTNRPKLEDLEKRLAAVESKINDPRLGASSLASISTPKKAAAARENKIKSLVAGKNPGGRPKKKFTINLP